MRGVGRRDPRAVCQRREQVGALRTGHFRQVAAAAAQDARAADAGGLVLEPQELVLGLSGVDGLCDLHVRALTPSSLAVFTIERVALASTSSKLGVEGVVRFVPKHQRVANEENK